jgi:hypothetical protein
MNIVDDLLLRFNGKPRVHSNLSNLRILYIGGYWRSSNDMVAQMLAGLKETGVQVLEYSTDDHPTALDTEGRPYDRGTFGPVWLKWEELRKPILKFRPNIIVCNAGGLSFLPECAKILRKRGIKLLGIALSDPDVYGPATSKIASNFDIFYTNAPQCVSLYRENGVNAHLLQLATNENFFQPKDYNEEYACDVLFMGAAHQDRIEPIKAVVENFNTHVYGENWDKYGIKTRGLIFGDATLTALNSARITLIFSRTPAGHQILKVGLFDFIAAGALVATEDFADLRETFKIGEEIIGFSGVEDMLEKIKYYLSKPEEAEKIRKAGRARVLKEYTWKIVWLRLLGKLLS